MTATLVAKIWLSMVGVALLWTLLWALNQIREDNPKGFWISVLIIAALVMTFWSLGVLT